MTVYNALSTEALKEAKKVTIAALLNPDLKHEETFLLQELAMIDELIRSRPDVV